MKKQTSIHTVLKVAVLLVPVSLVGCADSGSSDDDDGTEGSTADDTPGSSDDDTPIGTTDNPDTGVDSSDDADDNDTGGSTDTGEQDGFVFADDPYEAYTQIDRHAAVEAGTAGIAAAQGLGFAKGSDISIRDDYNASNPAEDAAGMWLSEISDSVTFFHAALDDDIIGAGLTPATVEEALAQAGPVIVPDTIKYDPSLPTAYPNGRTLEDPVVDITLAAVLLQLGPTQPLSALADLPLNPPANDVPFAKEFPYLAPPHPPKK